MSYTKRQFILAALEELGLGASVFDVQSEELESALVRLDSMMASWDARGIRLGYPIPYTQEQSDINSETNVPAGANEAVICNLAMKIAPSFGKVVARETKVNAKMGMDRMLSMIASPSQKSMPSNMPLGQGHKSSGDPYSRFTSTPQDQDIDPLDQHYLG